ncbi:MAG: helix-hairpin-helix domain-containing protein [Candidatus Sericytochromatia bacterium]|nr:helix-hairpin-helix domain-containing protein [Candidatus Sericytochromatia bacterium]
MSDRLVLEDSRPLMLGQELGRGGEGTVHALPGMPDMVAKLYHPAHFPDAEKQAKLRTMTQAYDEELASYAAWPRHTLHRVAEGPVVGFVMPRMGDRHPLHMLYAPGSRKRLLPDAGWDFLLCAARNTAAAFEAVHRRGHVVGDINPGNILFAADSRVALIDCDSFQVREPGLTHRCKVGVGHFTPPELQGLVAFDALDRTFEHDHFGLALLLFHLLFGGRHPFAGVPLMPEAGEVLDEDIKAYRYAHAPDAAARGLKAAPGAIPVSLVPHAIEKLFLQAFTEEGTHVGRPSADQWVEALDELRGQLRPCTRNGNHAHPLQSPDCPWCAFDAQGLPYFLPQAPRVRPTGIEPFQIHRFWWQIEALQPVPLPERPAPERLQIVGRPLPEPKGGVLGRLRGVRTEARRRREALFDAEEALQQAWRDVEQALSLQAFQTCKGRLAGLKASYLDLARQEGQEEMQMLERVRLREMDRLLRRHAIEDAEVAWFSPAKREAVAAAGMTTAADVTREALGKVPTLGGALVKALLDWRASLERGLEIDPVRLATGEDREQLRRIAERRRQDLEEALRRGREELVGIEETRARLRQGLLDRLTDATTRLAQARADVAVLG